MCGSATVVDPDGVESLVYGFTYKMDPYLLNAPPRFNIRPTEQIPVFRADGDGAFELTALRWGLIPSWSEGSGCGEGDVRRARRDGPREAVLPRGVPEAPLPRARRRLL